MIKSNDGEGLSCDWKTLVVFRVSLQCWYFGLWIILGYVLEMETLNVFWLMSICLELGLKGNSIMFLFGRKFSELGIGF